MNTDGELRIGVIGVGGRGALAHCAHDPADGVRLAAGADINQKALDDFKQEFGPEVFVTKDYKELLAMDDIGAVFVTSPDFCHEEHALAALEAGKHVYLEKPMAITIDGCDKILKAARARNLRLYLGHNMRHMSPFLKMKELIDNGAVGQVKAGWCRHFVSYGGDSYFKDWHAERSKSTGLLLQKGSHDIDVLHWLCGGYSKKVTAMGALTLYDQITDRHDPSQYGDGTITPNNWPPLSQKGMNPVIDVEDISMMLMTLDNGVLASYQQCHYTPDAWRNYTIIGTEGRIENIGDLPGESTIRLWNNRADSYVPDGNQHYVIPPETGTHGGADPSIVREFLGYIRHGAKITTSAVAARYSVAAGCMATHSLRNGGIPVEVPRLPEELAAYFDADVA